MLSIPGYQYSNQHFVIGAYNAWNMEIWNPQKSMAEAISLCYNLEC